MWHPKTGMLISASTDRGIIVWALNDDRSRYLPSLCNIKELKSNLDVAWNSAGNKFVVGATSGHVYVGTFDPQV